MPDQSVYLVKINFYAIARQSVLQRNINNDAGIGVFIFH